MFRKLNAQEVAAVRECVEQAFPGTGVVLQERTDRINVYKDNLRVVSVLNSIEVFAKPYLAASQALRGSLLSLGLDLQIDDRTDNSISSQPDRPSRGSSRTHSPVSTIPNGPMSMGRGGRGGRS